MGFGEKFKKGKQMWAEAKAIIPGGTQLLSKRSEMFLPNNWPSYFKKAKGIKITDVDGNTHLDFSIMGVGSCILGYANNEVNSAVKKVVDDGSMSTLNSPEELELAKELISIHPWANSVRYARTGGEAMAIAVRIARAYSKRDKLAFCGYHGWHDWYLAANLTGKDNLEGHLLSGLEPEGVPQSLIGSALPFKYNDIAQLEKIVRENDIGTIIVEPLRHEEPTNNFLKKVREIADRVGAVLIFDEVTIAWRKTVGGVHLLYGVNPDIAVFGKAMSNGFPMAAIIGKKKVMDKAQSSFISSTYWTERVGPAAALATIKELKDKNVPAHLDRIGGRIGEGWKRLAKKHGIRIKIMGPNALIAFSFEHKKSQKLKTLFTQEMLKRGFLATTTVYVSYAHNEENVSKYLIAVDEVFGILKKAIVENSIESLLEGPVAHTGFTRLTA